MNTQIIEQARAELMQRRIVIDNALNSLEQVNALQGGTTAVEVLERHPEAGRERPKMGKRKVARITRELMKQLPALMRKGKGKRGPYKKRGKGSTPHPQPLSPGEAERVAPKGRGVKSRAVATPAPRASFAAIPRTAKLVDAVRAVAGKLDKDGTFTRASMAAEIVKGWPGLAGKVGTLSVYLLDMMSRGELKRKGAGTDAVYSVGKLKGEMPMPASNPEAGTPGEGTRPTTGAAPAGKDPWAGITVRRDPDPEG